MTDHSNLIDTLFAELSTGRIISTPLVTTAWSGVVTGTGTVVQGAGFISCRTGTTTGGDSSIHLSFNTNGGLRRDRRWAVCFVIGTPSINVQEIEVGVTDLFTSGAFSGNNDDFAVFYLDTSVSQAFYTRTNDGGASAPAGVSTGVMPIGEATKLTKLVIINDETDIKFYINGVLVHTATSDLPTAATPLGIKLMIQSESTSDRHLNVFQVFAWQDDT